MCSIDQIRAVFKRIGEIQAELKLLKHSEYKDFRIQNTEISDLEHYNLRRILRNSDFEPIDTLQMRKNLIDKWEERLKELKMNKGMLAESE